MIRLFAIALGVGGLALRLSGACAGCETQFLRPVNGSDFSVHEGYSWSQGEAETNKIDLLIAFDRSAVRWLDSVQGGLPREYAVSAVDALNAAISNTGLDAYFTFRLAGVHELPVDLSDVSFLTIVKRASRMFNMPSANTEELKELRAIRETVAADVVAILVDSSDGDVYGGANPLSSEYVSKSGLKEFADYAYCACAIDAVEDRFTLLHEIGHVCGAGHGSEQKHSPGPALYGYSAAHHFIAGGRYYTSVMGYPNDGYNADISWERLPFFSSPAYTLLLTDPLTGLCVDSGVPTGTDRNDNTRTLRATYPWVANFRVAVPLAGFDDGGGDAVDEFGVDLMHGDAAVSAGQAVTLQRFVETAFSVVPRTSHDSPVTVSVRGLPSGLKYEKKTGMIRGMPKRSGTFDVRIRMKDREKRDVTETFVLRVGDHPDWAVGTFNGYTVVDGVPAAVKLKIYGTSGRVKWSYKVNGKTRRFSLKGFESFVSSDDGIAGLHLPGGIAIRPVAFRDHAGVCSEIGMIEGIGPSGLIQDAWSRKDLTTCRYKKKFTYGMDAANAGIILSGDDYLDLTLSSKGKSKVSGRVSGRRISSSTVTVRLGAGERDLGRAERAEVIVVLPAKKKGAFTGLACKVSVRMTVGDDNRIVETDDIVVSPLSL